MCALVGRAGGGETKGGVVKELGDPFQIPGCVQWERGLKKGRRQRGW